MNKKIYIAIILLGASMLGVISFQVYWLKQNHINELQNFKHDVYRSLSVAMNLELDKRIENMVGEMEVDIFQSNYEQTKVHRRRMHKMMNNNSTYFEMEEVVTSNNDTDTIIWNKQRGRRHFNYKKKQLDRVLIQLMSRMDDNQHLTGVVFDTTVFNNSFKKELTNVGIDIDYKLALLAHNNRVMKNIHGNFDETDLRRAEYYSINSSAISGAKIAILFPNRNWYIASKNGMMSVASIILIILSLGSIVYIIRSLFSQKRISEIRRDFMNNMTHELKTPISTVGLALEAMQNFKILEDPKRTEQYIGIARKENHRLGMLVEKVLKMSAYERENIHMKWELIKVMDLD